MPCELDSREMDSALKFVAIGTPLLLGLMGLVVALWPPGKRARWLWVAGFLIVAAGQSGQSAQSGNCHIARAQSPSGQWVVEVRIKKGSALPGLNYQFGQ